ncbi:MAG: ABC transporter permease [Bacteroidetes bacterium]|nr:ABC transporter permease [Bacteroidota bacterium]MBK8362113.1 ABC transporter permease [Bacteroidota bacterium]MBL0033755.1 ABC transporter permease [Bacteroidota bacterium]
MSADEFDIIIDPNRRRSNFRKDLWNYRGLFYFLSWRDILVRYKQTVLGVLWSIIRPLMTIFVFTIIFGRLAKLPSDGVPYLLLVSAGMIPWQFFANSFTEASNSLIANATMLSKVYFPRIIIPVSSVVVSFIDLLISFAIMIGIYIWYQFVPDWHLIFLPLFILQAIFVSMGLGFLVSALNVRYRDFRYIVPFIVQFGLYISPVGFKTSVVTGDLKYLYALNPMVGVIDGFRWSLLGGNFSLDKSTFAISLIMSVIIFIIGFNYFRKVERNFADII